VTIAVSSKDVRFAKRELERMHARGVFVKQAPQIIFGNWSTYREQHDFNINEGANSATRLIQLYAGPAFTCSPKPPKRGRSISRLHPP